jgi:hypothetical protein
VNDARLNQILEAVDDDFEMKDLEGPTSEIENLLARGLALNGSVSSSDSHYVHERSTTLDLDWSFDWPQDMPAEEQQREEARVDAVLTAFKERLAEQIVDWNEKIYSELEAAYEDSISEETVAESIRVNEYEFDENGEREDDTGLHYDDLSDRAKENARAWFTDSSDSEAYSESVIVEWKWLLDKKGFKGVDIHWSGFWSQGDGASFTARYIDFSEFFAFPDPLEFPEADREQLWESEEEDFEAKDLELAESRWSYTISTKPTSKAIDYYLDAIPVARQSFIPAVDNRSLEQFAQHQLDQFEKLDKIAPFVPEAWGSLWAWVAANRDKL